MAYENKERKNIQNSEKKITQNVLSRGTMVSRMINPELFIRPVSALFC